MDMPTKNPLPLPYYKKGLELVTKEIAYGMMLNALCQVRDILNGDQDTEDLTVNPDMYRFDDYSIDEVVAIAKFYENR